MEYHPETLVEKVGAAVGSVAHRIEGDLERFKKFIESRGQETGAWRGNVDRPPQAGEVRPGDIRPGDVRSGDVTGTTGGIADPADRAPRGGTSASSVPPTGPDRPTGNR
jgi:hypothetical protein